MPQSDGMGGQLRRIALQVGDDTGDGWYKFRVNPTQYTHSQPQRVSIFKTKSNIITEDFGKDIETIQFSGTTGFRKDSTGKNGADRLKSLKALISDYASQGGNGNRSKTELKFFNFTDDEYYIVHLAQDGIKIERSVDQPLLFTYTISLVVLREAGQPSERDIENPEIGNFYPSIGNDTGSNSSNNSSSDNGSTTHNTGGGTFGGGGSSFSDDRGVGAGSGIVGGIYATVNGGSTMFGNLYSGSNTPVNPSSTVNAYQYGVDELKKLTGYGVVN